MEKVSWRHQEQVILLVKAAHKLASHAGNTQDTRNADQHGHAIFSLKTWHGYAWWSMCRHVLPQ